MATLTLLFPGSVAYGHALEAGLSALNPVVHPAGVLLNAGRIERSRGEFWFYEEGVTPGVVAAIEAVDGERRALGAALGLRLTPVAEAFVRAGFGPASADLWAVINGSRMRTQYAQPGAAVVVGRGRLNPGGRRRVRWSSARVPGGVRDWAFPLAVSPTSGYECWRPY